MNANNIQTSLTVVNTDFIAGREIASTLGVVFAQGHCSYGTAGTRAATALAAAWQDLQHQAHQMDADAVINVQTASSGIRGFFSFFSGATSAVTITGTAVKLK